MYELKFFSGINDFKKLCRMLSAILKSLLFTSKSYQLTVWIIDYWKLCRDITIAFLATMQKWFATVFFCNFFPHFPIYLFLDSLSYLYHPGLTLLIFLFLQVYSLNFMCIFNQSQTNHHSCLFSKSIVTICTY